MNVPFLIIGVLCIIIGGTGVGLATIGDTERLIQAILGMSLVMIGMVWVVA